MLQEVMIGSVMDIQSQKNRILDKVLIVGLGQLGPPVAKDVKERGFDTYGYDISIAAMELAQKIASIKEVSDLSEALERHQSN
jgi:UDP-N-acetyl-D-mannosaminuronic acid dehydrogenase